MPRLGSLNNTYKATRVTSVFGEFTLTTPSTVSFVVPLGVTSVNIGCLGGGGGGLQGVKTGENASGSLSRGGGGGALAYSNTVAVTPGETLTVTCGAGGLADSTPGGASFVKRGATTLVLAAGAAYEVGGLAADSVGTVKYNGGNGGFIGYGAVPVPPNTDFAGGGGAAGWTGAGGNGGSRSGITGLPGDSGQGTIGLQGGGGGGAGYKTADDIHATGGGGGGTTWTGFQLRQNTGGAIGTSTTGGQGGLGNGAGSSGGTGQVGIWSSAQIGGAGGLYGGGSGSSNSINRFNVGQGGFVRIIWGPSRSLPNINSDNLTY